MLAYLRELPSLHSLTVHVGPESRWLSSNKPVFFKNLCSLGITAEVAEAAVRALDRLIAAPPPNSSRNRHSDVHSIKCSSLVLSSLLPFATSLQSLCSDNLVKLYLSNDVSVINRGDPFSSTHLDALRALTSFKNLEYLKVWFWEDFLAVSADNIRDLVRSWPKLKTLFISPVTKHLSLSELIEVMRLLPHACDVTLPTMVEDAELSALNAGHTEIPCFVRVKQLNLGYSRARDWDTAPETVQAMASLLFRLVPRLEKVEPIQILGVEDERYWGEVMKALRFKQTCWDLYCILRLVNNHS